MKAILIGGIATAPFLFSVQDAAAQRLQAIGNKPAGTNLVTCPANTCNNKGGPRATDAKYCKASNCKKG